MPKGPQRRPDDWYWQTPKKTASGTTNPIPSGHTYQSRTCNWCGGSGHDPHFGGSSETCQSCAGSGMEERYTKEAT